MAQSGHTSCRWFSERERGTFMWHNVHRGVLMGAHVPGLVLYGDNEQDFEYKNAYF